MTYVDGIRSKQVGPLVRNLHFFFSLGLVALKILHVVQHLNFSFMLEFELVQWLLSKIQMLSTHFSNGRRIVELFSAQQICLLLHMGFVKANRVKLRRGSALWAPSGGTCLSIQIFASILRLQMKFFRLLDRIVQTHLTISTDCLHSNSSWIATSLIFDLRMYSLAWIQQIVVLIVYLLVITGRSGGLPLARFNNDTHLIMTLIKHIFLTSLWIISI